MTPANTLDFGSESYLTPRKSVRDCALSLDPPSLPPRINQYDRHDCKIISREGLKTLHQTKSSSFHRLDRKTIIRLLQRSLYKNHRSNFDPDQSVPVIYIHAFNFKFTPRDSPDFVFVVKSEILSNQKWRHVCYFSGTVFYLKTSRLILIQYRKNLRRG